MKQETKDIILKFILNWVFIDIIVTLLFSSICWLSLNNLLFFKIVGIFWGMVGWYFTVYLTSEVRDQENIIREFMASTIDENIEQIRSEYRGRY